MFAITLDGVYWPNYFLEFFPDPFSQRSISFDQPFITQAFVPFFISQPIFSQSDHYAMGSTMKIAPAKPKVEIGELAYPIPFSCDKVCCSILDQSFVRWCRGRTINPVNSCHRSEIAHCFPCFIFLISANRSRAASTSALCG